MEKLMMFAQIPGKYRRFLASCLVRARISRAFGRYSTMTESMNEAINCIDRMMRRHIISRSEGIRLYRRIAA